MLSSLALPENMPLIVSIMFFISAAPHDIHSLVEYYNLFYISLISRHMHSYCMIAWARTCPAVATSSNILKITTWVFLCQFLAWVNQEIFN